MTADLDGAVQDQGPTRVFAFYDCGPAHERYEIPKFLHIMGEPEALALAGDPNEGSDG